MSATQPPGLRQNKKTIHAHKKGNLKVKEYSNTKKFNPSDTYIPSGKEWEPIFEAVKKCALTRLSTFALSANFFRRETPRDAAVGRESTQIAVANAV